MKAEHIDKAELFGLYEEKQNREEKKRMNKKKISNQSIFTTSNKNFLTNILEHTTFGERWVSHERLYNKTFGTRLRPEWRSRMSAEELGVIIPEYSYRKLFALLRSVGIDIYVCDNNGLRQEANMSFTDHEPKKRYLAILSSVISDNGGKKLPAKNGLTLKEAIIAHLVFQPKNKDILFFEGNTIICPGSRFMDKEYLKVVYAKKSISIHPAGYSPKLWGNDITLEVQRK